MDKGPIIFALLTLAFIAGASRASKSKEVGRLRSSAIGEVTRIDIFEKLPAEVKRGVEDTWSILERAETIPGLQGNEVDKIYLIGSFAKGTATKLSDVDVVVKFKRAIPGDEIANTEYELERVAGELRGIGEEAFLETGRVPSKAEGLDIWIINNEAEIATRFGSPAKIDITERFIT